MLEIGIVKLNTLESRIGLCIEMVNILLSPVITWSETGIFVYYGKKLHIMGVIKRYEEWLPRADGVVFPQQGSTVGTYI